MSNCVHNPPYYITAYGLACKMGFEGTLEEWLDSLTAFYMAQQAGFAGTKEEWVQKLVDPVPKFSVGEVVTLEAGSEATVTIAGTKEEPILNFGIPRGVGATEALTSKGFTMQGGINMGGFGITNLPEPKAEKDAVPKSYADKIKTDVAGEIDEAKKTAGDAQSAAGSAASAASAAANAADAAQNAANTAASAAAAAQNVANAKATKVVFTTTIPVSEWVIKSNFAECYHSLTGLMSSDVPTVDLDLNSVTSIDALKTLNAWWGCVLKCRAADNILYFAVTEAPTVDIPVKLEVLR